MSLAVTFFTPTSFKQSPQRGRRDRMTWDEMIEWVSTPIINEKKDAAGGWSSAHFDGIALARRWVNGEHTYVEVPGADARQKRCVVEVSGLGLDFDDGSPLESLAERAGNYRCFIHSTHSSTPQHPKHRLWFPFNAPLTSAVEYDRVWRAIAAHFEIKHLMVDKGTKDASRLWYVPVAHPQRAYSVRIIEGKVLDPREVLAVIPPEPKRDPIKVEHLEHADKYIEAALNDAARKLAACTAGERHDCLNREAYSLARLGLSESQISSALRATAIQVMGDGRIGEIDRTIRDAVRARGAA